MIARFFFQRHFNRFDTLVMALMFWLGMEGQFLFAALALVVGATIAVLGEHYIGEPS